MVWVARKRGLLIAHQHVRLREWRKRDDVDFAAKIKLKIPKNSRHNRNLTDDKTTAYADMFFTKFRNLKPWVLDAYWTKNNWPEEQKRQSKKQTGQTNRREV